MTLLSCISTVMEFACINNEKLCLGFEVLELLGLKPRWPWETTCALPYCYTSLLQISARKLFAQLPVQQLSWIKVDSHHSHHEPTMGDILYYISNTVKALPIRPVSSEESFSQVLSSEIWSGLSVDFSTMTWYCLLAMEKCELLSLCCQMKSMWEELCVSVKPAFL